MTKPTASPGSSKKPAKPAPSAKRTSNGKGSAGNASSGKGKPLPPKVQRFIDEYMVDMNGTAAYQRAGYSAKPTSADANARRLLGNARIAAEIARRRAKSALRLDISREQALQEAWNIVKADANELVEFRRTCCDECWGVPTTQKERARDPNPACTDCGGEGHGHVHAHDTRKLSPAGRSLYAGVKVTKEGFEVKMHSKLEALEKVFKHLGLYAADKPQPPKLTLSVNGTAYVMSEDELTAIAATGRG